MKLITLDNLYDLYIEYVDTHKKWFKYKNKPIFFIEFCTEYEFAGYKII